MDPELPEDQRLAKLEQHKASYKRNDGEVNNEPIANLQENHETPSNRILFTFEGNSQYLCPLEGEIRKFLQTNWPSLQYSSINLVATTGDHTVAYSLENIGQLEQNCTQDTTVLISPVFEAEERIQGLNVSQEELPSWDIPNTPKADECPLEELCFTLCAWAEYHPMRRNERKEMECLINLEAQYTLFKQHTSIGVTGACLYDHTTKRIVAVEGSGKCHAIPLICSKYKAILPNATLYISRFPCHTCVLYLAQFRLKNIVILLHQPLADRIKQIKQLDNWINILAEPEFTFSPTKQQSCQLAGFWLYWTKMEKKEFDEKMNEFPNIKSDVRKQIWSAKNEFCNRVQDYLALGISFSVRKFTLSNLDLKRTFENLQRNIQRVKRKDVQYQMNIWYIGTARLLSERARWMQSKNTERMIPVKVGCVLVSADNREIVGMGYSGSISGTTDDDFLRVNKKANAHAELNAVVNGCGTYAFGICQSGTTAYLTHLPCDECTRLLVGIGVTKLYYIHNAYYRLIKRMAEMGKLPCIQLQILEQAPEPVEQPEQPEQVEQAPVPVSEQPEALEPVDEVSELGESIEQVPETEQAVDVQPEVTEPELKADSSQEPV